MVTSAFWEPLALDAPVVTAILPDNVTVRWPARPAWFDDATMIGIQTEVCKQADNCSAESLAWMMKDYR